MIYVGRAWLLGPTTSTMALSRRSLRHQCSNCAKYASCFARVGRSPARERRVSCNRLRGIVDTSAAFSAVNAIGLFSELILAAFRLGGRGIVFR